jgi:hypothetical protein
MYQARLADTEEYLRHLCHSIHANPVRHGLAAAPERWPHSDYRDWLGLRGPADQEFIRRHFGSAGQYAAFVREYIHGRVALPENLAHFQEGLEA